MFGHRRLLQGVLNDDERDTTGVPKQTLNAVLWPFHTHANYSREHSREQFARIIHAK